jgi:hypothetical protein
MASSKTWRYVDFLSAFLLLVIVTLSWCSYYDRWTREAWETPVIYGGDAWGTLAGAKALGLGEIRPILMKFPKSLGAPFRANWNDYPTVEEGIFAWLGLLVRAFGLFVGTNLALLSAHLLAAWSFYFVCRQLSYSRAFSVVGATLFSLSPYAFLRGLPHLTLIFYWHVPLGLLVVWWCLAKETILTDRKKLFFCIAVAVLHGAQNPYYSWMFLQFLILAAFICLVRRAEWSRVLLPLFLAGILMATFALVNADTFYYRLINGPNPSAIVRSYEGLERYALKPVELFLPNVHSINTISAWAMKAYFNQALFLGEVGSAYLGIVGIVALVLLLWSTIRNIVAGSGRDVPLHFWALVWILAYSVVAGGNALLGLMGIVLFRCSNRYSIVILAVLLLFLVRQLTFFTRRWSHAKVIVLASSVTMIGIWDQIPPPEKWWDVANVRPMILSDAKLVSTIEGKLRSQAMIFQLPVMDFPEVPPLLGVSDYEQLRPYFFSRRLRFSYGSDKGRYRERWQSEAEQLGPQGLVTVLENYGFSAVLINRKGYADRAQSLLQGLNAAGRANVLAESSDFICIALSPAPHPVLPPEFDGHWYALEGDLNSSSTSAQRSQGA